VTMLSKSSHAALASAHAAAAKSPGPARPRGRRRGQLRHHARPARHGAAHPQGARARPSAPVTARGEATGGGGPRRGGCCLPGSSSEIEHAAAEIGSGVSLPGRTERGGNHITRCLIYHLHAGPHNAPFRPGSLGKLNLSLRKKVHGFGLNA
jgi:hypothetical protein